MKDSIGTYNEKTIHAFLKKEFEPDEQYHEIKYKDYIADIKKGDRIVEIQSTQFKKLEKKIKVFTEDNHMIIVYPIPRIKRIVWIDTETGELSKPRRSPKVGSKYDIFLEMYMIRNQLCNPNLHFVSILIDLTEYRYLSSNKNKKYGTRRAERIPCEIVEEVYLNDPDDITGLIPSSVPGKFTSQEFASYSGIKCDLARTVILVMRKYCIIRIVGKCGRYNLYERTGKSYLNEIS